MEGTIRLIRKNELEQLLELYSHLHNDDPILRDKNEIMNLWEQIISNKNTYYIVVDMEGQIVASCMLVVILNLTRNARPYGLIENVVTHKNFRRRGFGKAILSEALRISKEQDCYKVMLLTSSKEAGTLNFYEDAGFTKGEKTGFVAKL